VTTTRTAEVIVYLVLLALALLLATTTGAAGWDGPRTARRVDTCRSICACSSPAHACSASPSRFGSGRSEATTFVTRDQLRRVMQVFVPTFLFCLLMQWLGLYVASFLLVAGFMRIVGRIAWWKSLLTSFLFALIMFVDVRRRVRRHHAQGPARSALRPLADSMEALNLLLQGFAVLLTWKI
jgi:hypothetical protein